MPIRNAQSPNTRRMYCAAGVVSGLLSCSFVLGGCSSASSYRSNPTPELATMSNTSDEVANRTTVTFDTNLGAIWEDAARFMLVDRPTLLTRPRSPY